MRNTLKLLVFLLTCPLAVTAQTSSKSVVNVDASGPSAPVAAGATFEASVSLGIRSGYHINANKPSEDYLIGTSLKLSPPQGVKVIGTNYPSPRYAKFEFSDIPLAVYEGNARITIRLQADKSLGGAITIPGKVTFQACNDEQCLPPSTVDVSIPVEIAAAVPGDDAAGIGNTNTALGKPVITLTGTPPGARVLVDGREIGKANDQGRHAIKDVKAGKHKVRVEAEGYKPWEQSVDVNPLIPQTVAVTMEKDASAPAIQTPSLPSVSPGLPKPGTEAAQPETTEGGGSNPLYYVIAAFGILVVVGGGLAAALLGRAK